jgi:hypothetical protein
MLQKQFSKNANADIWECESSEADITFAAAGSGAVTAATLNKLIETLTSGETSAENFCTPNLSFVDDRHGFSKDVSVDVPKLYDTDSSV